MPHFPANPLENLAIQAADAEASLDLSGLDHDRAMDIVEALLQDPDAAASYHIRFDPPAGDGRETLFQPLGKRLLQARRDGQLSSCLPLPTGDGYYIAFSR